MIPSLLKWIGNKQRFASLIVDSFPLNYGDYYEPFLGSGAVLAEVMTRKQAGSLLSGMRGTAHASDVLLFLTEIFEIVRDDPDKLTSYYEENITKYYEDPEGSYLKIRDRFNEEKNALDFCLLSRTCYSGVIRFRKSDGHMSTPRGPHKPIPPKAFEDRVEIWSELMKDVDIRCEDFRKAMRRAKKGDLVYCDPPYTHSQSIIYGAQSFDINDLWAEIDDCKQRGVYVALSINGTRQSKKKDISADIPSELFNTELYVDCGISMIDRLQKKHAMDDSKVHDKLMLTWNVLDESACGRK